MSVELTREELERELVGVFAVADGVVPSLTLDCRKLEVRFLCTASGNESVCSRYKPGRMACTFRHIETNECRSEFG